MLMISALLGLAAVGFAFSPDGDEAMDITEDDTAYDHEDAAADRSMEHVASAGPPDGWGDVEGSEPTDSADAGLILSGSDDADVLRGSEEADEIRGGDGDDLLRGGKGDDWIQGDSEDGGAGDDTIHGDGGNDWLAGGAGDDRIGGGSGDDTLYGASGRDLLLGGRGDDALHAGAGRDSLEGGRGDDVLSGNDDPSRALLDGGTGDDTLEPGAGDWAAGGGGHDSFFLKQVAGKVPSIMDFDAQKDEIVVHIRGFPGDPADLELSEDSDGQVLSLNGHAIAKIVAGKTDLSSVSIVWVR